MNPLNHVAIIMDGNGRWGLKKYNSRNKGHRAGLDTVEKIIKISIDKKIKYLTLFAFSTENWKRPKKEINYIFSILNKFIEKNLKDLISKNIKLKFIGENKKIDLFTKKQIYKAEKLTKENDQLNIFIAFNYSSKIEITNSVNKFLKSNKKRVININQLEKNLYTGRAPNPELLIRTGGYKRLSDFLLWQLSFSEIFFIKKNWPDFNKKDLLSIIKKYKKIKRNFGSV